MSIVILLIVCLVGKMAVVGVNLGYRCRGAATILHTYDGAQQRGDGVAALSPQPGANAEGESERVPLGREDEQYKLNPSGHRRQVIEGARTTTYGYDALYRLTSEAIAGDSHGNNGTITYTLDKVGNRLSRTSNVSALSSQTGLTYNARDELSTDTYDANGNTMQGLLAPSLQAPGSFADTYDFENRLIVRTKSDGTSINISYDADGNRTQKNLLDLNNSPVSATTYLVDTNNLTGYAQVAEERKSVPTGVTLKVYTYGNQLLSCTTTLNNQPAAVSYFGFDGHGNVRELTDSTGAVTDRYDYDAFGNLVYVATIDATTGKLTAQSPGSWFLNPDSSRNHYLYCGEQFDADLGLYYNRARYLNTDSGRFWSMDTYPGRRDDPASLHKYLYAYSSPVAYKDPTGRDPTIFSEAIAAAVDATLNALARISPAFLTSGAAGGAALAEYGGEVEEQVAVLSEEVGAEILQKDVEVVSRLGGPRLIDLLLKIKERIVYLEVKTSLPNRAGDALNRLIGQIESAVASAPPNAQVSVFAAQADEVALNRVYAGLSEGAVLRVNFVIGYGNLVTYLQSLAQ